jgi:hypothetical protein
LLPEAQAVEVVHVEGSDGPTTWSVTVYRHGWLEFQQLGQQPRCKRVGVQALDQLFQWIDRDRFDSVDEFEGFLGHQEWMQVRIEGVTKRIVAEELPAEIVPLFQALDQQFSQAFGQRYSWLLLTAVPQTPHASASEI